MRVRSAGDLPDGIVEQWRIAYRARRRSKSWKSERRSAGSIISDIATGLVGGGIAYRLLGPGDLWTNVVVPGVGALIGVAANEYLLRPLWRFVWVVPEDEHIALKTDIGTVEANNDVYRRNIDALSAEVTELRTVLDRSKKNHALADGLTLKHKEGVTDILNRPPKTVSEIPQWRERAHQWQQEVEAIMYQHGCSVQEMNHVQTIGMFSVFPGLHPDPDAMKDLSMFAERLNRVANIATKYGS
jgi:hypothetical protein